MTERFVQLGRHAAYVTAGIVGDLDIANVEQARLRILDNVPGDAHGLIVDLSAAGYVDSAGVHMLFEIVRKLDARRQRTGVVVPSGSPMATLLKITNLNEAAPVCASVEACAEALSDELGLY